MDRGGGCGWWGRSDILLGPEETSVTRPGFRGVVLVFSGSVRPGHQTALVVRGASGFVEWCGCVVAVGVRGWPLFENCTVDASIFVVKLSRADGECLGTRSR